MLLERGLVKYLILEMVKVKESNFLVAELFLSGTQMSITIGR